jgi:hypothetical protein
MYWPVNSVARDGQQSAVDTNARSKVVPPTASAERTPDITRMDSTVWSSVMITTMFGRGGCARGVPSPQPANATADSNSAAVAVFTGRRPEAGDRA